MINVKPGIDVGEFAHVEFGLSSGATLPTKDKFSVTVNNMTGGSTTDPNASFSDLLAAGFGVTPVSVTGL
jgi:hypothetical protein